MWFAFRGYTCTKNVVLEWPQLNPVSQPQMTLRLVACASVHVAFAYQAICSGHAAADIDAATGPHALSRKAKSGASRGAVGLPARNGRPPGPKGEALGFALPGRGGAFP